MNMKVLNRGVKGLKRMDRLMQEVERLAIDYYTEHVSDQTSLILADVLEDIVIQQGIEIIYLNIPKVAGEERILNGMFFKHENESVQPKIVINQLDTVRTQNFTLAHEWFHAILALGDLKKYAIKIQTNEELERAGDYFSASILMNQQAFISYFRIIEKQAVEAQVFKLADIFKVPYVSVIRRLRELNLATASSLMNLTEEELIEMRCRKIGPSVLDLPPKRAQFSQYEKLVKEEVIDGRLSNLEAAKKLAQLNVELSEKYFDKAMEEQDLDAIWNEMDEA